MGRYPKLLPVSRNDPERFSRALAVQQRFQFIDFLLGLFDFIAKLAEVEPGELTVIQTVAFHAARQQLVVCRIQVVKPLRVEF